MGSPKFWESYFKTGWMDLRKESVYVDEIVWAMKVFYALKELL